MGWTRKETHAVGSYVFHWFSDHEGSWLIGIWNEKSALSNPTVDDIRRALTVHHISTRDNPKNRLKPLREFCMRFVEDVPFRVRAIRNKTTTLRKLGPPFDSTEPSE